MNEQEQRKEHRCTRELIWFIGFANLLALEHSDNGWSVVAGVLAFVAVLSAISYIKLVHFADKLAS